MSRTKGWILAFTVLCAFVTASANAQEILPFPPTPSASVAGRTLAESTHQRRVDPKRLPADVPNILIILLDDTGPGLPSTYGGEINTPTLDRIAQSGISYNRFHSTAMCSPSRAALLTGRNHHRVGNGQIAELAADFDGYSGVIPKTSALVPEVLKDYGYSTAAFGKWHNTPANQTTAQGPFDFWPTGYGFEYFYGFLGGEASQYEPQLVKNTTYLDPHSYIHKGYHLSEDLADNAIGWLRDHQALAPDKPFFIYWAPGASHGPHHITKEWIDKYKGKFDDGWDKYRERVFKKQKEMGWIPANTELTSRPETLPSWDSIPDAEKPFQRRLMEVYAGFTEHVDAQAGRMIDEIAQEGKLDNTLVFYIWGDNGSSAEGQNGTISELLAQNGIPSTIDQHMKALDELGGLDALGGPKVENMYHAGWAWAGSTPFRSTKLVAAHFGGTRQPLAIAWPKRIKHDGTPRSQFSHFNDVVPTIYEALNIRPPQVVNGFQQDTFDGTSLVYTFDDANAKGRKKTQYFEIMGSRGLYQDGWFAGTFGPRTPWIPGTPKSLFTWTPDADKWELYNLDEDFSQAHDLADKMPDKVEQMKQSFLVEATKNNVLPIGGGLYIMPFHPGEALQSPYTSWKFGEGVSRIPEGSAPKIGIRPNLVSVEADLPADADGVVFALGAMSGGLTCYLDKGTLCYEYNCFELWRTKIRSNEKLPAGKTKIEVQLIPKKGEVGPIPAGDVTIMVNGKEVGSGTVPILAPVLFTANDCLDIGADDGSPVSLDYFDRAPFKLNGKITGVEVKYIKPPSPAVAPGTAD